MLVFVQISLLPVTEMHPAEPTEPALRAPFPPIETETPPAALQSVELGLVAATRQDETMRSRARGWGH